MAEKTPGNGNEVPRRPILRPFSGVPSHHAPARAASVLTGPATPFAARPRSWETSPATVPGEEVSPIDQAIAGSRETQGDRRVSAAAIHQDEGAGGTEDLNPRGAPIDSALDISGLVSPGEAQGRSVTPDVELEDETPNTAPLPLLSDGGASIEDANPSAVDGVSMLSLDDVDGPRDGDGLEDSWQPTSVEALAAGERPAALTGSEDAPSGALGDDATTWGLEDAEVVPAPLDETRDLLVDPRDTVPPTVTARVEDAADSEPSLGPDREDADFVAHSELVVESIEASVSGSPQDEELMDLQENAWESSGPVSAAATTASDAFEASTGEGTIPREAPGSGIALASPDADGAIASPFAASADAPSNGWAAGVLSGMAQRVLRGEIVVASQVGDPPEAVLAQVLAALLTPRS